MRVIFHGVDPSDVNEQTGYFGSVFEKTCGGKSVEDVEKWKHALEEVSEIVGFDSRSWLVILICPNIFSTSLYMCTLKYIQRKSKVN